MQRNIIIVTLLPENGTTGVQTHFNSFKLRSNLENNLICNIVTPYTFKKNIIYRIYNKIRNNIFNKILTKEKYIIFTRELLLKHLKRNVSIFLKKDKINKFYLYAQDPSSLIAVHDSNSSNIIKSTLICHFNISESNEYNISQKTKIGGILDIYLHKKELDAFNIANHICFPSNYLKEIVLDRIGLKYNNKSFIINNFTDSPEIYKSNVETDFLMIGSIEPRKNQMYGIEIINELHKIGLKVKLTIIGDGESIENLKNKTKDYNLEDYIIFKGFLPNAKNYLQKTKYLLHTSLMENFPITLLESLSYGKPICGSNVGGIPEIIDENENGILIELDDAKEAACKIYHFIKNSDYNSISKNAIEKHTSNYDSKKLVPKLKNIILGE